MYLRRFMGGVEEFTDSQHYIIFKHIDEYYTPIDVGTYSCRYDNKNYEITIKHVVNYKLSDGFITKYYFDQDNNICPEHIIDSNDRYHEFIAFRVLSLEFSSNIQYIRIGYSSWSLENLILPNDLINCYVEYLIDNIDVINIGINAKYIHIYSCNNINTINYNAIDCEFFSITVNNIKEFIISNSIKSIPTGNLTNLYNIANKCIFHTFNSINQLYTDSLRESTNTSNENIDILHERACINNKELQYVYKSRIIPYNCYYGCNVILTNASNQNTVYIFKGNKFIDSKMNIISNFQNLCYAYELYNFDLNSYLDLSIRIIKTLILDNNFNINTIYIPNGITYININDTSDYTKKLKISACDNKIICTNKIYEEVEIFDNGDNIDISDIKTKKIIIPINVNVVGYFDNYLETIKFNSATQLHKDIFIHCTELTTFEGDLNTYINFSNTIFYKNLPVDEYGCIYYNNYLIGYDKTKNQHIIENSNYLDVIINENCTRILIPFSRFEHANVFIPSKVNVIYPSTHYFVNITIDENNHYYNVINNHIITNSDNTNGDHILTVYNESSSLNDINRSYYLHTIENSEIELNGDISNIIFNGTVIVTDDTTFTNCFIKKLIPENGNIIINNDNNDITIIDTLEIYKYSENQINITGNYKINNVNTSNTNGDFNLKANNIIIESLKNSNKLDLSNNSDYEQVYISIHDKSSKSIYLNNSVKKLHIEDKAGYSNYNSIGYIDIFYNGTLEELLNLDMDVNIANKFKKEGKVISELPFIFEFHYKDNDNHYKTISYDIDLSNCTTINNKFVFNSIQGNCIVIPNSINQLNLNIMCMQYIDLRNLSDDAIVNINFNYNFLLNQVYASHYIYLNTALCLFLLYLLLLF